MNRDELFNALAAANSEYKNAEFAVSQMQSMNWHLEPSGSLMRSRYDRAVERLDLAAAALDDVEYLVDWDTCCPTE